METLQAASGSSDALSIYVGDVRVTAVQGFNLRRIIVERDNVEAGFREEELQRQAHIALPHDSHGCLASLYAFSQVQTILLVQE